MLLGAFKKNTIIYDKHQETLADKIGTLTQN
jgi:hypothetical protein